MKKLQLILIILSFSIFFSCASKPAPVPLSEDSPVTSEEETVTAESDTEAEEEELSEIIEPEVTDLLPETEDETQPEEMEEWDEEVLPVFEEDEVSGEETENNSDSDIEAGSEDTSNSVSESAENLAETESSENPSAQESLESESDENTENETSESDENDSIDITEEETVEEQNNAVTPSRSVTMKVSEYLDVSYPGSGWIFMGATDNSKTITYFGRKLGTENTNFSLQARLPGTKILHFYKNDTLKNQIIDDYIEVVVLQERGNSTTHVQAPDFKMPLKTKRPVKTVNAADETSAAENQKNETVNYEITDDEVEDVEQKTETKSRSKKTKETSKKAEEILPKTAAPAAQPETVTLPAETESTEVIQNEAADKSELLASAQTHFDEKNYKAALAEITEYLHNSKENCDQALYLQGQILEAKSEIQDVNAAIKSYTTLTKNYPASKFWDKANKRIIYLKRFYLQGR